MRRANIIGVTIIYLAVLALVLWAMAGAAFAAPHYRESVYQRAWCSAHGGAMEVILPKGLRADCITAHYAVEVDFARKWAEAVGQSMAYAAASGKQPAIVLIIEHAGDERFVNRLRANFYWIKVFTITPREITP